MAQQLAELTVDLVMKGWDQVEKKIGSLKGTLAAVDTGIKKVETAAKYAFVSATASIMGFVHAGLQGTMQGEALQYRMMLLSREITAVFLPTIDKVISYLSQAVRWFQGLSREEQDSIRKKVLLGIAALAVVANMDKLIGVIKLATLALQGMYANPVLAGLALLAAAVAFVGIQAYRAHERMKEAEEKTERFRQGKIYKSEWEKSPTNKALKGSDSDDEALRRLRERKRLLDEERHNLQENFKKMFGTPGQRHTAQQRANQLIDSIRGGVVRERYKQRLEQIRQEEEVIDKQQVAVHTGKPFKPINDEPRLQLQRSINYGQWHSFRQAFEIGQARVNEEEAKKMFGQGPSVEEKQLTQLEMIQENTSKLKPAVA